MRRKLLIGLAVFAVAAIVVLTPIPSLLYSLPSAMFVKDVRCEEGLVTMSTATGRNTCVIPSEVERMEGHGWGVVERMQDIPDGAEVYDRRIIVHTADLEGEYVGNAASRGPVPVLIIDMPEQIKMGEVGTINVEFTYGEVDGDDPTKINRPSWLPDHIGSVAGMVLPQIGLTVDHPEGVEILNDDFETRLTSTKARGTPLQYSMYTSDKGVPFDPFIWQSEEIRFRVNEPVNEHRPSFNVYLGIDGISKWLVTKDGIATFLDENPHERVRGEGDEPYDDPYLRSIPPPENITPGDPTIPPLIDDQYHYYLEGAVKPYHDVREWLEETKQYPQEWIDELLATYPDLEAQNQGAAGQADPSRIF